jgi:hypothetical protein
MLCPKVAKSADLPVMQATNSSLVINAETVRLLGPRRAAIADEGIE